MAKRDLDPALERRALTLFGRYVDAPAADRAGFVAAHAGQDQALAERLNALIQANDLSILGTDVSASALLDAQTTQPDAIGAYRLVERVGQGGMGAVFKGERIAGDFTHVVAIKIIKPGMLSEALVARFERERAILANLHHPNIAQLLDGGELSDGSPYIIMEYVDGAPLLEYARRTDASLAERKRLFIDICKAVAAAHRNLIVHRDLTPSNVLITKDGMVKLIDFGISRPIANPSDTIGGSPASSIGGLSMTPGYAAPERLTKAPVRTSGDVYSLGRIMSDLFADCVEDIEFSAIVARATHEAPEARYPTADALRLDVEAWRDQRPVSAMAGAPYVIGKFIRRNRTATAAALAALVFLTAGVGFTAAANARAQQARDAAEHRFGQTRQIAHSLLFEGYDAVREVQGSAKARQVLAAAALEYVDAMAASSAAPTDVKLEAARNYARLAQIIVNEGGGTALVGEEAATLLLRAEALIGDLKPSQMQSPMARLARASLLVERAKQALKAEPERAGEQARRAQNLIEPIAATGADAAQLYVAALNAQADSLAAVGDAPGALSVRQRAQSFIETLPEALRTEAKLAAIAVAQSAGQTSAGA